MFWAVYPLYVHLGLTQARPNQTKCKFPSRNGLQGWCKHNANTCMHPLKCILYSSEKRNLSMLCRSTSWNEIHDKNWQLLPFFTTIISSLLGSLGGQVIHRSAAYLVCQVFAANCPRGSLYNDYNYIMIGRAGEINILTTHVDPYKWAQHKLYYTFSFYLFSSTQHWKQFKMHINTFN